MLLSIPKSEFKERQQKFIREATSKKCEASILFAVADIFYLTGFHFHPTERPIGMFLDPQEKVHLFLPQLETEHAEEYAVVDYIHDYPEYPGIKHPMEYFKELLVEFGFENKSVGYDAIGYGSSMGYRGQPLNELISAEWISVKGIVEELRFIKSEHEIELIKESCRWGNLAHRLLQKYSKAGFSEIEVSGRASMEATMAMIETLGPEYKPHGQTAFATFRGQVGPESAFPHAVTQNIILKKGDTLVTGAAASVFGYTSELERTMFVEEYNAEQEKHFNYMLAAQDIAIAAIKPGVTYSDVEEEVQRYFKEEGITGLTRHHTGHNIGILGHEAPFFDLGDHTEIKPGMVVTVEPGIYVPGLGGFRHSDTVLVTESGNEMLTYYPRDLESMIC